MKVCETRDNDLLIARVVKGRTSGCHDCPKDEPNA